jgi:hypothetical protein
VVDGVRLHRCLDWVCTYISGAVRVPAPLRAIVDLAVASAPAGTRISITSLVEGVVRTAAASHEELVALDRLASPMITTFESGTASVLNDAAGHSQWPEFASACSGLGVCSVVAFPLVFSEQQYGTFNVFSSLPKGMAQHVHDDLKAIAALATTVLAHDNKLATMQRKVADLEQRAMRHEVIDQAKGVLVATLKCSVPRATQMLIEQSQAENRKMHEVARSIVEMSSRKS